jgi:hypothetical protein
MAMAIIPSNTTMAMAKMIRTTPLSLSSRE